MFSMFPFATTVQPSNAASKREMRERELEARMSAFLTAKRDDASQPLIKEITAQRDRLRGTRYNRAR